MQKYGLVQLYSLQSKLYIYKLLYSELTNEAEIIIKCRLSWSGSLVTKYTLWKLLMTSLKLENYYVDRCYGPATVVGHQLRIFLLLLGFSLAHHLSI